MARIKSEVRQGLPSADIVIGPHWMILGLEQSGLLTPYESPEFATYKPGFYNTTGAWCAMALSPVGLAYNANFLTDGSAPAALDEVADSRWKGKLAMHELVSNREGQMGLTYMTTLASLLGNRRWSALIDRLVALEPTMYECMPDMALNIGLGRSWLGFPATMSCIAYYFDIQNRPIKHVMPSDLPFLYTFAPSIGFTSKGEDPEWAKRAFDYALSEDWQGRVESFGGKIPARTGIASDKIIPERAVCFPTTVDLSRIPEYEKLLSEKFHAFRTHD